MSNSTLVADVSSNNGSVDIAAYRAAGHVLLAIKATEGEGFVSPTHRQWATECGRHGVGVLHYHFARPDTGSDPEAEARFFLEAALPLAGGRDYLSLDLERATPQGWAHDPAWSRTFDEYVRAHSRFATILYANRSTLQAGSGWLSKAPERYWDADWSGGPDFAPVGGWVALRQFTDGVFGPEPHSLLGIGRCDVNVMRGVFARTALANAPR